MSLAADGMGGGGVVWEPQSSSPPPSPLLPPLSHPLHARINRWMHSSCPASCHAVHKLGYPCAELKYTPSLHCLRVLSASSLRLTSTLPSPPIPSSLPCPSHLAPHCPTHTHTDACSWPHYNPRGRLGRLRTQPPPPPAHPSPFPPASPFFLYTHQRSLTAPSIRPAPLLPASSPPPPLCIVSPPVALCVSVLRHRRRSTTKPAPFPNPHTHPHSPLQPPPTPASPPPPHAA